MQIPKKNYVLLLVLTCLAIFFVNLDALYVNIMEARNFITAREMLIDGNWLLTTFNGEPRYQKPPLPTWLTAISAGIFGLKSLFALRLPAAIVTVVLVLSTFKFLTKLTRRRSFAFIAALILSTSFYIVFAGRNGQWDIFTHAFMMVCIYNLYLLFERSNKNYKYAIIAGLFFGLSFMSKGPVSLYALLLPFLISYGIVFKFRNLKDKWFPLLGFLIIAFVLSGWWHWYTLTFDSTAASAITQKEATNWLNYEVKPFYYYWSFFTQSGIWTIPAFISLLYPYLKDKVFNKKAYLFTFLWTVIAVVLLSIIPEKKSRYLLPVLIPLAMNTGFYIEYLFRKFHDFSDKKEKIPVYFNFGLIATIGVIFPIAGYFFLKNGLEGKMFWFVSLSIVLFIIGILMWRYLLRKKIKRVFYLNIFFIAAIIVLGMPLAKAVTINPEYKGLDNLNVWQEKTELPVFEFASVAPELIWAYGNKMNIIKNGDSINIPNLSKFGVTVSEDDKISFRDIFKDYKLDSITRYDMNAKGRDDRSHKTRLYRDFFLVTKKEK